MLGRRLQRSDYRIEAQEIPRVVRVPTARILPHHFRPETLAEQLKNLIALLRER